MTTGKINFTQTFRNGNEILEEIKHCRDAGRFKALQKELHERRKWGSFDRFNDGVYPMQTRKYNSLMEKYIQ